MPGRFVTSSPRLQIRTPPEHLYTSLTTPKLIPTQEHWDYLRAGTDNHDVVE